MLVHHVVRHSRPASVRVTFVSFINHYFVTRSPLNPGGIVAPHWFGEYVSSFFPYEGFSVFRFRQCHRESFSRSQLVVVIVPHVCMYVVHACSWCEAERNQNKPNGLHLSV